ncbi:MAG TPA: trypsin-like serine peptidase [Xylella sp.]
MKQFRQNKFFVCRMATGVLFALLSLGANAEPSDKVIMTSISEEKQRAALDYWTDEHIQQAVHSQEQKADFDDASMFESKPVQPAGGIEMMSSGRLMFTRNGQPGFCTANAVESESGKVIATAGHCVVVPANQAGTVHIDNLVFFLHYRNEEFAQSYPVRNIFTVTGWGERGEAGFDFAFVSTGPDRYGYYIKDMIIPSPIRFTANPVGGSFTLYGYPGAFGGGELPYKCIAGRVVENPRYAPGPTLRITTGCPNFSEGASGGPAMQSFPDGIFQTGNVSHYIRGTRDPRNTGAVQFTYWENAAHGAWDRAQHDQ